MADTESKQEPMQRNLTPVIDRIIELLHGRCAKALDIFELL